MSHQDDTREAVDAAETEERVEQDKERVPEDEEGVPEDKERVPEDEGTVEESPPADGNRLEFSGAVGLETTKDHLWETISDPETLTTCVPGAESIERIDDRTYTLEITRGISHVSVSLSGEAEFVEMNPPDYIVTRGSAFDSKTGTDFDVLAAMELDSTSAGVELVYQAEVSFSGGAAVMKTSLLRPIVERDVNTYFENVRGVVEGEDGL